MLLPLSIPRLSPRSRSRSSRRSLVRSSSSTSTLSEALRTNPFRQGSRVSLALPDPEDETTLLNKKLATLAELYPDVKVEVLRELLLRFKGDSGLQISAEQLCKHKSEWARGRLNIPPREPGEEVPPEELFKRPDYVAAAKKTLGLEFRGLSRSTVDAVLAEVNSSYGRARPILQGLANKSWRNTFSNFFRRKRPQDELPTCLFESCKANADQPRLLLTGSIELDEELAELFLRPRGTQYPKYFEADVRYAEVINEQEARDADALFECQCCYNDVVFEAVATCGAAMHVICFDCIRRTLQEALFGQGWPKSIDQAQSTLRCLAPLSGESCPGCLPSQLVRRAVLADKAGSETWAKYEERLTLDALQKSHLKLVSCPFCPYAEADHVHDPQSARRLKWRFRKANTLATFSTLMMLVNILPLLLLIVLPCLLAALKLRADMFYASIGTIAMRHRPSRFRCQRPSCLRASCLKCQKAWHDPHVCHEPLLLSLRTTVETARTAAIKRTCPRCGTSFVKSSGCNKLTCTCGYAMCYLCRKNIGRSGEEGAEGYRHFCEHFRPVPGRSCTECQKCDLYLAEDEDTVAKRAGQEAERVWRIKEGMVGVAGLEDAVSLGGEPSVWQRFRRGDWTVQGVTEWAVDRVVVVEGY